MAVHDIKELCRLCAKKNEFSKDLLEDNNKNILDLVKHYTQIAIMENDSLPTKICLDCEEKMVSFQLFILECYKVQDTFNKIVEEQLEVKTEGVFSKFEPQIVKSEVKDEFIDDEMYSVMDDHNDDSADSRMEGYNVGYNIDSEGDEDDELDNLTIASLKQLKGKIFTNKILSDEEAAEFQNIIKNPNLKMKDIVELKCVECDKPFSSWAILSTHYIKIHNMKPIIYCKCGITIRSKGTLYKHVTEHKRESRSMRKSVDTDTDPESKQKVRDYIDFKCSSCGKQCTSWYSLKSHCQRAHKRDPVVTCTCGITIKSKSVMYKHVTDHKNPTDLSCDKCSLVTKSVAALNKHKLKHIPKEERKFICSTCNKIFSNKDALKSHERSHIPIEERKVFRCEICDLKFTTRSAATSHKRVVHEKIKSYVCDLCGYACGTNGELRQHRAIHSDEKPFVCNTCSKSFKTYSNLKTHMDTHEQTSYVCYVCNRVLNSRRTLRKHLLVHEDKCRHICSYCNKAFKRRQTLKVHMYTHTGDKPLSCKWCDERFAYASTLRSHRLRCHPDKMASQQLQSYTPYLQPHNMPENYIKNDLAAINITKSEVEPII